MIITLLYLIGGLGGFFLLVYGLKSFWSLSNWEAVLLIPFLLVLIYLFAVIRFGGH